MTQPKNKEELIQALKDQTPKSGKLWNESQDVVPGGLLSLARKFEPYPFYTHHGEGPYLWDVDENRYIDCCMSYGVLLLGHASAPAKQAIADQNELGAAYGTPHPLEIKFSERLIACVPCADRVLLCNSGRKPPCRASASCVPTPARIRLANSKVPITVGMTMRRGTSACHLMIGGQQTSL